MDLTGSAKGIAKMMRLSAHKEPSVSQNLPLKKYVNELLVKGEYVVPVTPAKGAIFVFQVSKIALHAAAKPVNKEKMIATRRRSFAEVFPILKKNNGLPVFKLLTLDKSVTKESPVAIPTKFVLVSPKTIRPAFSLARRTKTAIPTKFVTKLLPLRLFAFVASKSILGNIS